MLNFDLMAKHEKFKGCSAAGRSAGPIRPSLAGARLREAQPLIRSCQNAVGLEVNANHVSAVPEGETVTALCRPLHLGRRTQVWQTEIHRPNGKLACVSRLTTAVLDRKAE
jgi:uncharacterized protein (TIGR00369 family)